ncbi:hypothetical protein FACS1894190_07030 [Spirochaetia bacterium]|nr:hypothetical protein FACS1894190_07030 [Spirochaetia bacterium]
MKKNPALYAALFCLCLCACPVTEPPEPIKIQGRIRLSNELVTAKYEAVNVNIYDKNGEIMSSVTVSPIGSPAPSMPQYSWEATFIIPAAAAPVTIFAELDLNGDRFYSEGTDAIVASGSNYDLYVSEAYTPLFKKEELKAIGKTAAYPLNGKYILIKNLDLSDGVWAPIGTEGNPFSGIFSGGFNTISGLRLPGGSNRYIGLFGYVLGTGAAHAGIKNLKVNIASSSISLNSGSSEQNLGIICGYAENAYFENIIASGTAAGLKITKANGFAGVSAGGIAGRIVSSATSPTTTFIDGGTRISGCASLLSLTLNADTVGNTETTYLGGIVGTTYTNGTGALLITIQKSYSTGTINLKNTTGNAAAGGINAYSFCGSGSENARIIECYSSGDITCKGIRLLCGGILGSNRDSSKNTISYSVSLNDTFGVLSTGVAHVGKISGEAVTPTRNYNLEESTIITDATGTPTIETTSGDDIPRSNVTELWFMTFAGSPNNWDFNSTWKWDSDSLRPVFVWQ